MPRVSAYAALTVVSLVVAACGGGASSAPSSGSGSPSAAPSASGASGSGQCATAAGGTTASATVDMAGFAFSPATVSIAAGETVSWTNGDDAPHNATMIDGACQTGNLSKGETGALTFTAAGTYGYRCTIHPTMNGTVEVS
jgi:plastocyanin